jgi:hypothetical protein
MHDRSLEVFPAECSLDYGKRIHIRRSEGKCDFEECDHHVIGQAPKDFGSVPIRMPEARKARARIPKPKAITGVVPGIEEDARVNLFYALISNRGQRAEV